jgi:hypothetical protein
VIHVKLVSLIESENPAAYRPASNLASGRGVKQSRADIVTVQTQRWRDRTWRPRLRHPVKSGREYVNIGANVMGRLTGLVKEGDR